MRTILRIAALAAVIGLTCGTAVCAAGTVAVRAYVDDTTVVAGAQFTLVLEVNGRCGGPPTMAQIDGLKISARPNTQASRMEFSSVANKVVSRQEYGYYAYATKPGKVTIPSMAVTVDGKIERTDPIELTVLEAAVPQQQQTPQTQASPSAQPLPHQVRTGEQPAPRQPGQKDDDQVSLDQAVFVETHADKTTVYQGEPIELTMTIWVLNTAGFRVYSYRDQPFEPPACEGFYPTPLEESVTETTRDGRAYKAVSYRRTLYPTVKGDLQIGEWRWEGAAGYGLREWRVERTAPAIPVHVMELPSPPPAFSGAVGQFTLEAKLSRDEGVQGVPMQLVVTVRGRGNPDAVGAPRVPKIERAYMSDPDTSPAPAEPAGADVEKTFTYLITPLEPGELNVPPVEYCYFDPSAGAYKTESTQPVLVRVLQSAEYGGPRKLITQNREEDPAGEVSVVGNDLFPLAPAPAGLRPVRHRQAAYPVAAVAPVAAYAGLALFMRRRRRLEQDPAYARSSRAKSRALKRLDAAAKSAEPAEELYRALAGYVADKYNLEEKGLTSQEAAQALEADRLAEDVREHVRRILRACERTRYGAAKLSGDELDALRRGAVEAIDRMESPGAEGSR